MIKYNPLLPYGFDELGGDAPPGSGIVISIVAGANITVDDTDPANPIVSATGGGSSLAVQEYQREQVGAATVYTGIADNGTATSSSGWSLLKIITTTDPERSRDVYTATDSWDNRATATYTLSNTYNF